MSESPYHRLALCAVCLEHLGLTASTADDVICEAALDFGNLDYAVEWLLLFIELWCRRKLMVIDRATIDILDRELARDRARAMDPSGRWA